MADASRKPLASSEKRRPKSIRWTESEWAFFAEAARQRSRGDVGGFIRDCAFTGLRFTEAQEAMTSLGVTRRNTA
jgi:hypothetical protein